MIFRRGWIVIEVTEDGCLIVRSVGGATVGGIFDDQRAAERHLASLQQEHPAGTYTLRAAPLTLDDLPAERSNN
jgi:hypothetical protein